MNQQLLSTNALRKIVWLFVTLLFYQRGELYLEFKNVMYLKVMPKHPTDEIAVLLLMKKLFYNNYGLLECLTFNLSAMYVTVSAQLLAGAFLLRQF